MVKVYIAGKYSDTDVIKTLTNMRKGIEMGARLLKLGFAPFCPFLDFQFGLQTNITMERYKEFSLEWLKVSDCILLLDNWTSSEGAKEELRIATQLGIQAFQDLDSLVFWYSTEGGSA